MRFKQVQRFVWAKKIFWGWVHLNHIFISFSAVQICEMSLLLLCCVPTNVVLLLCYRKDSLLFMKLQEMVMSGLWKSYWSIMITLTQRGRSVNLCMLVTLAASLWLPGVGKVAFSLVHLSPERAVQVQALTRDVVLCSCARHLPFTMPLIAQVYKWVPANLMLGVTLWWTSMPSRGGVL